MTIKVRNTLNIVTETPWQAQIRKSFNSVESLLDYLNISPASREGIDIDHPFTFRVTQHYADQITPGDIHDPLLHQVLPRTNERQWQADFTTNPVGDNEANKQQGLLHKYHGRVLVIATSSCPIHCRYCFRRNFDYGDNRLSPEACHNIRRYIEEDPSITEIILSGGDPLMLSDQKLKTVLESLVAPQIKTVRIHSKMPSTLPDRLSTELLETLNGGHWRSVLVSHINHPREITPALTKRLETFKRGGITLLNQSVLLRGVNDQGETLIDLSHTLFQAGIMPYYLHLLDKVSGAHHFEVEKVTATELFKYMQARLPGYLVPKMVQEIAGKTEKTLIAPRNE